ncbi:uncharacterized protein BDZ83DRAFT_619211 [Colletotrichum acutatum]|uniref:Uncharacterized protein n=1 Tax=Glomerella acutata TaxID=27357 RepID=A0AAD8ULI9_GLOAC|nr:uncharacterized protein BDZ83DRAFT_619211 [Colletotrichum acutatum]KAK1725553.1 hypothetical protein BDZ83DRAFT_619211 [Colletotrichum acutatum]
MLRPRRCPLLTTVAANTLHKGVRDDVTVSETVQVVPTPAQLTVTTSHRKTDLPSFS